MRTTEMTEELNRLSHDPEFAVDFAIGDTTAELVPQDRKKGPHFCRVYYHDVKKYVLKSAHLSREDVRIFDVDSGKVVLVSHHPGKNPYEFVDPLGLTNQSLRYDVAGGEWESICDISALHRPFRSFSVRPKWLSRHGRQYIKHGDDILFNVGKLGKLKTMSLRSHFVVGTESAGDVLYKCIVDMMDRTMSFFNTDDERVAIVSKTTKAVILSAAFGHGSESVISIAPGVDCSVILAALYAIRQVGAHFMGDAFSNFVVEPGKDAILDSVVENAGLDPALDAYTDTSDGLFQTSTVLINAGRFIYDNFFA